MIVSLIYIKDMGIGVTSMVVDASMSGGEISMLARMNNKEIFSGSLDQLKAIVGQEKDENSSDGLATEIYTDLLDIVERFNKLLTKK